MDARSNDGESAPAQAQAQAAIDSAAAQAPAQIDRREEPRFPAVNRRIEVSLSLQGVILNISNSGFCLRLPGVTCLELNQPVAVHLDGDTRFAIVRWINDDRVGNGTICGCEFELQPSEGLLDFL